MAEVPHLHCLHTQRWVINKVFLHLQACELYWTMYMGLNPPLAYKEA